MGILSSTARKPLTTAPPIPPKPTKKQFSQINVHNEDKVNKLIKKNSHAITKSRIQLLDSTLLLPQRYNQRHNGLPSAEAKLLCQKRARKIAQVLKNQKTISNLHYAFIAPSSFTMTFIISKLKELHHLTSLILDLSSVNVCSPQHLKSLSIVLGNFKKLTSLAIIFPDSVEMTSQHISSLGFVFHRLRALSDLSLKFSAILRLGYSCLKPLAKLLCKLNTRLKSLSLSQFASITPLALTFLPPIFKKITSYENLSIDLANMGCFQSKFLNNFFLTLKDHHKTHLKYLAFNFKNCSVDFPNSDPLSKGLAMLDLSKLQSFELDCYPNQTRTSLQQIIATLQKSPLRRLNLDLTKIHFDFISLPSSSNLQSLKYLSELTLTLNPGVQELGALLKPLVNLKSLEINLLGEPTSASRNLNNQMIYFAAGFNDLKNLKHFSLNLKGQIDVKTEGLKAISAGLQNLTGLSSLNLGFAKMEIDNSKRISALCFTLGKLTKLTDLSLDFSENQSFDHRDLNGLAEIIPNISSLRSIYMNFSGCNSLAFKRENFEQVFKGLGKLKLLNKIVLEVPYSEDFRDYEIYLKHVEDQNIQRVVRI